MRDTLFTTVLFILLVMCLIAMGSEYHDPLYTWGEDGRFYLISVGFLSWIMNAYLCVVGSFIAFRRWDRFAMSHEHPIVSKVLSFVMAALPFLGFFVSMYFTILFLGMLFYSQVRSKTEKEKQFVKWHKSNALYSFVTLIVFSGSMALLNFYPYLQNTQPEISAEVMQ